IIKAAPTPPVAKTELMSRAWDSATVRAMLARAGENREAFRPQGLEPRFGMQPEGLYRLSETQAEQILQMRLQRPTGLEQAKTVNAHREVMDTIADLRDILARADRITTIIADELGTIQKEFGDKRRSEIVRTAEDLATEDLITPQDVVVTLSHTG